MSKTNDRANFGMQTYRITHRANANVFTTRTHIYITDLCAVLVFLLTVFTDLLTLKKVLHTSKVQRPKQGVSPGSIPLP